jgi:acetolactate synthase small subunit
LQSFLEQPFDLLIGYFNTNNLYLETAILQSNATFKAGFSGVNSDLYELEIAGNIKDIHQFLSELKKYLQSLKKLKS